MRFSYVTDIYAASSNWQDACGVFHQDMSCAGAEHQKKIGQQAQDFQKTFRDEVSIAARFTSSLLVVPSAELMAHIACL